MRRPLACLAVAGAVIYSTGCGSSGASDRAEPAAEDVWLSAIGSGDAQTARVCARGASDRVAQTLCDRTAAPIRSLVDLYRALGLDQAEARNVAVTTHSLGLSARTVSGVNPRVVITPKYLASGAGYEKLVSIAFSRGEQLVELVGLDPASYEYNFYLLRFQQACSNSRCTPEDLLTERIEGDWTGFTLYADQDLEDTPLDCLTCHLPFGRGSHKLLLMRQTLDPWLHWSDFRNADEHLCASATDSGPPYRTIATSHGVELSAALEGATGRYAGVPVAELQAARSGAALVDFMVQAELLIEQSPHPPYPYAQLDFPTREVLCERFHAGTSPSWDEQRLASQRQGLPVPFYEPDVFDPDEHPEWLGDRAAYLRSSAASDAFDVASDLLRREVAPAVGFVPREQDSAPEILRGMCVRCHAAGVDPRFRRSRFDASALDAFSPATAAAIRARLALPKGSPALMPPRRMGELPAWAIASVERYLREHCSEPGACD